MKRTACAAALVGSLALPARAEWSGRPAYRALEKVSDGVYGFMRGTLTSTLPRRLTRDMAAAPERDSYEVFREEFSRRHDGAVARIRAAKPTAAVDGPSAQAAWRGYAAEQEQDALLGAFAETMVGRYKLESFGENSGAYAKDRRNWDASFLAPAAVFGGAYLWVAGVDAGWRAGPARVGLRVAPGWRWRAAGGARRLATVELSPAGSALKLSADWGGSGPEAEAVALNWTRRF
jgi:hypothetical protein